MPSNPIRLVYELLRSLLVIAWRQVRQPTERRFRMDFLAEILRRDLHRALDGSSPVALRQRKRPTPIAPGVARRLHRETIELASCSALRLRPLEEASGRTFLYLHGGGYCICSPETHQALMAGLALITGAEVIGLDYRLAPEHPCPAAIDDAVAACRALYESGVAPEHLVIGGDSAGGGLTLATLQRLQHEGGPLPAAAILFSPWVDLSLSGESIDTMEGIDYLSRPVLAWFATSYRGELPPNDPAVSPLGGPLEGLPPLLIQVGGSETLRDEAHALEAKARQAGVEVTLQEWPGAVHVFQAFDPFVPEAREALDEASRFVKQHTA